MSVIQIVEIALLVLLLLMLLRFSQVQKSKPPLWNEALKRGKIPGSLRSLYRSYPDKQRFYIFWLQIERILKENVRGAFAELGVYKGESARIIHNMAPDRKFHLFDTFGGFTDKDLGIESGEAATYSTGNFADTSQETARQFIRGNENVVFHPGYFPDSAKSSENEKFAFVNMDVDLYNPTKAGLEFFYPRLSPGGVILIHDYNSKWPMLIKAVDEFVSTIPESLVLFADKDGSVMIVKGG